MLLPVASAEIDVGLLLCQDFVMHNVCAEANPFASTHVMIST